LKLKRFWEERFNGAIFLVINKYYQLVTAEVRLVLKRPGMILRGQFQWKRPDTWSGLVILAVATA
jgi:hypothetical protein